MAQWPCPRFPWLHCALISLTIHGMTPDPRDVTSGSITRILRCIVSRGVASAACESPLGDDATDEKPDEVCTPASSASGAAERCRRDSSYRRHRVSPLARTFATAQPWFGSSHPAVQTGRRLAALGRFTC